MFVIFNLREAYKKDKMKGDFIGCKVTDLQSMRVPGTGFGELENERERRRKNERSRREEIKHGRER